MCFYVHMNLHVAISAHVIIKHTCTSKCTWLFYKYQCVWYMGARVHLCVQRCASVLRLDEGVL